MNVQKETYQPIKQVLDLCKNRNSQYQKERIAEIMLQIDVINRATTPFAKFLSKSALHLLICNIFFINHFMGIKDNFEKIMKKVCPRVGSRSTILNCLKEGVESEIFIKHEDNEDRRIRYYSIKPELVENMMKRRGDIYEELLQQERKLQ